MRSDLLPSFIHSLIHISFPSSFEKEEIEDEEPKDTRRKNISVSFPPSFYFFLPYSSFNSTSLSPSYSFIFRREELSTQEKGRIMMLFPSFLLLPIFSIWDQESLFMYQVIKGSNDMSNRELDLSVFFLSHNCKLPTTTQNTQLAHISLSPYP